MPIIRRFLNIALLTASMNCVMGAAVPGLGPVTSAVLFCSAFVFILAVNIWPARVRNDAFRLRAIKKGA